MSKIGRVALEAQEEVLNPLGYSTVDEAIADGWDSAEWMAARESEQEKAHEAWLNEKQILMHEVEMLINDTPYQVYKDTLRKVVKFLEGVSHE